MAKSDNHVYSIDLDISTPQASKQALKELQEIFNQSNGSIDELNKSYIEMSKYTKNNLNLEKQYSKVVAGRLSDRDKEIDKLEAEKISIAANKELTEKQRKETLALKDAKIQHLKADKQYIKAKEKETKLLVRMNKLVHSNLDENSKAFKIAKSTISVQEKLNALLGKESKLRKAVAKAAAVGSKVATTVGKAGLKAVGGAMAIGGAVVGAAASSAGDIAEKERALESLKSGIDPSIVDSVYVKSGADYSSIVAAVNALSDVTRDSGLLIQGAVLELRNPGAGKLLLSQTHINEDNIIKLNNVIAQIKKQTGAQDLSAAIEASTKSREVTTGKVSQTEYLQAYAALSQQGIDEEKINRIIKDAANKKGDFIENINTLDLTRYAEGQDKNRFAKIKLGLEKLKPTKANEASSAQSVVEKLREFELKKNEIMIKLLPVVDKILTEISNVLDGPMIERIAKGLVDLLTSVLPLLEPVLSLLDPILKLLEPMLKVLQPAAEWLAKIARDFIGTIITPLIESLGNLLSTLLPNFLKSDSNESTRAHIPTSGGARAQGGIITSPTIVGEAGPELVLPLDYSRAGRASQIINNFNTNQSFNMAANQTTPLAFSQAVGQNRFIQRVNSYTWR